jgi:hypothetical protein
VWQAERELATLSLAPVFGAKGALFNRSLGQRPRFAERKTNSAEGAIHCSNPSFRLFNMQASLN